MGESEVDRGEGKRTSVVSSLSLSKFGGVLLRVIQYSCEVGIDAELKPKCGQIHPAILAPLVFARSIY